MPEHAKPLREPHEHRVREVAATIYGTILVTALVAGLSEDESIDAWQILVSVTATTLVFWIAHAYAEVLSKRVVAERRLSGREAWRALAAEWPMVTAAGPAALALGLGALGAYSTETAVTLAIGLGVGELFVLGLALGRSEGASLLQTFAGAMLNATFGLVIVVLKAFVH